MNEIVTSVHAPLTDTHAVKSAAASRVGKAIELLVAAFCILATKGELNVSTSIVDDEGIDLVFSRRNSARTLAVQVKGGTTSTQLSKQGSFKAFVRAATMNPGPGFDYLFVEVDDTRGAVTNAWLVPSTTFAEKTSSAAKPQRRTFAAYTKLASKDQWHSFRLSAEQLPNAILERLAN